MGQDDKRQEAAKIADQLIKRAKTYALAHRGYSSNKGDPVQKPNHTSFLRRRGATIIRSLHVHGGQVANTMIVYADCGKPRDPEAEICRVLGVTSLDELTPAEREGADLLAARLRRTPLRSER